MPYYLFADYDVIINSPLEAPRQIKETKRKLVKPLDAEYIIASIINEQGEIPILNNEFFVTSYTEVLGDDYYYYTLLKIFVRYVPDVRDDMRKFFNLN